MAEDKSKTVAILSYFLIGIIWYFVDEKIKKDKFVKYHVKQAINIMVIGTCLSIALNIVFWVLFFIAPLWFVLYRVVWLAWTVLWIIGIINAAQKKQKPIPFIGEFADKYLTF